MAVAAISVGAPAAQAQEQATTPIVDEDRERPLFENWPEILLDPEAFDGEELSEEARRAVEQLLAAVEPMMAQLSLLIRDLPRYEAPVILPNGDILIRRAQPAPYGDLAPELDPGETDRERTNPDGSLDL